MTPLPESSSGGALPTTSDCWGRIGVLGGDRSCPELVKFIHCRNCPVHAEAGAKLLDRALPAGYREEWTRRLKERTTEAAARKESALVFRVGNEWLALPTKVLKEVAEKRAIRSLPHQRSAFVRGLTNVRGELVLCLSFEELCAPPDKATAPSPTDIASRGQLLVTQWNGFVQAFPVDEIGGLVRFHRETLPSPPPSTQSAGAVAVRGVVDWNEKTVLLLDEDALFSTINVKLM